MKRGAIISIGVPILILIVLPIIVLAALGDGQCQPLVQTACGGNLDSSIGLGATEICGDCYICGVEDGICPESYSNTTTFTNCSSCPDPDCNVSLTGFVFSEAGIGIPDAEVSAQLLHIASWKENYTTTTMQGDNNNRGKYSLNVPKGSFNIVAKAFGYDLRVQKFTDATPLPNGAYQLNFTLANGTCNADCTGYVYDDNKKYCKSSCNGYVDGETGNVCSFETATSPSPITGETYNIAELCDGREAGQTIVLDSNNSHSYAVDCCTGTPSLIERTKVDLKQSNIDNLIQKTFVTQLEGEAALVKVRIVVYEKN